MHKCYLHAADRRAEPRCYWDLWFPEEQRQQNGCGADTSRNAAGPGHPLLGSTASRSSQHRCHEAGMQTARPKCKLHHGGRGRKNGGGGRRGGKKRRQRRQLQRFATCTPAPADPLLRALMQSCAAKLVGLQASEEHAIRRTWFHKHRRSHK